MSVEPVTATTSGRRKQRLKKVGQYALLTFLAAVVLFPIYITIVDSLLRPEQITTQPPKFFPTDPQWSSYQDAWNAGNMGLYLKNSFIVTAVITVGQVVTAVLAGYAFAFLTFPFKRTLFVVFLATLMVPFEVTIVTNVTTIADLGWYNSYAGLAVPFLATGFGAFLMRQAFLTLPRDLHDAASLDGYGHWRFMTRVAVPLARPAVAALTVFAFLSAWNQYLWPLLVTRDDEYRTVQIGLKQLRNLSIQNINVTFAGAIIAVVPLVILLLAFQKQLVRGLTTGAVKGSAMMSPMMQKLTGMFLTAIVVASGLVVAAAPSAGAQTSTSCPLNALKKASKPVEITMWHSMPQQNEKTLQALAEAFNSSQSDVKVNLVNQIDYAATFTKYKAGLSSGELPDVVQLQETEQQQMIDTGSIVPSGACAKADKYSFSDFLPRVVSYYTVDGQMYAMPFNTSGPVLYYNKKSFTAAGLDPEKPPTTLDEVRTASEKLKAAGVVNGAPFALKLEPGYVEHWLGLANKLFVNQSNGRKGRTTASVLNSSTGKQIFSWLGGMVGDGLAATNNDLGSGNFDNLLGIGAGNHAMTIDTSASLGTITAVLGGGGYPNVDIGVAPMPALQTGKGGVLVSGGALYIVNKSSPEKQAAAWQWEKFLDDTASQATWAVGTGYVPIRKSAAQSKTMQDFWAQNPFYKIAYDQLANGPVTAATAGSVIGNYLGVRNAVRDGENSMFLNGTAPAAALKATASNATAEIRDYNDRLGVG